jgi:hypothetical protein
MDPIDILLELEHRTFEDGTIAASVLLMHAIQYLLDHPAEETVSA